MWINVERSTLIVLRTMGKFSVDLRRELPPVGFRQKRPLCSRQYAGVQLVER